MEQKNYTHVRQFLGYERMEHEELIEPVNELLKVWSLWRNLYCATMKQISSHREKGLADPATREVANDALPAIDRLQASARPGVPGR
ncbi:MAG: hypothetical protein ACI8V5_001544 [Limisphaerales bacterium]